VAVTPERVPLGLIQQQTWIRPESEFGKKTERRKKALEEKESVKWLRSLQAVEQLQTELPDVQLISVGDREADIYDLFKHAAGMKADLLVRASSNRRLECEEAHLYPPERPPTLNEAIKLVVRVGGFLARKGDGAPGPLVLWRGLQELATISFAWFAFGPERAPP
jgi:hypothetical protein